MKKLVPCSADAKRCARQVIIEAFDDILCKNFKIPSQEEMKNSLKNFIDYTFEEYQVTSKVIAKHPQWTDERINDEVYRLKMRYDNEYGENLTRAASAAISEIEQLISSLNDTIKAWKIKNLE